MAVQLLPLLAVRSLVSCSSLEYNRRIQASYDCRYCCVSNRHFSPLSLFQVAKLLRKHGLMEGPQRARRGSGARDGEEEAQQAAGERRRGKGADGEGPSGAPCRHMKAAVAPNTRRRAADLSANEQSAALHRTWTWTWKLPNKE